MNSTLKKHIIYSLAGAAILTVIAGTGVWQYPDRWVQDELFQKKSATSGDIVIIGIDEAALSELGPYHSWDRNVMASALDALASDPDRLPAVVAIDTLYSGTTDPEADTHLAQAADRLGCVVTASVATFGTTREYSEDGIISNTYSVLGYEQPFDELRDVTTQGHINAMIDTDGIMRHALLYVDPVDEEGNTQRVYSMAATVARLYLEQHGQQVTYPETNARGHFYVPFTTKPFGYYDGINIAQLIRGEVPADYYAGKIVLIGPYAAALQDEYFTPIERSEHMFGVEFQANVIQSLIDKNFKTEAPDAPQLAVLFAVSALAMFLFLHSKVIAGAIYFVIITAASMGVSYAIYQSGRVIHPLWIPVSFFLLYIATVVIHYIRAAAARAKVYSTFERYVAPSVVKELMKEGTDSLALGGKLCDIAVLFVDVRGFTTMSERLEPEKVVYIINKILTMTSSCIEKNNGTLDKYVGDCTMAFWGAPLPQEDSVYLAARTALDIVKGCEEVSAQLKEETGEEFKVGVGVHYGPAVVGNIGSERRMDYTAIGDTVNTSARLEANAPGSTVYISRVVADKLGDLAKTTSLGDTVKLKGKADGFEVLILESLKEKDHD
ncbi:MAG: adenylate/guanylate cyclase domain-containing protein [Clostridiales bacterium]|nr:adenylate/guanylate cyclase domain-containing protein [Clostridiales bacterium]